MVSRNQINFIKEGLIEGIGRNSIETFIEEHRSLNEKVLGYIAKNKDFSEDKAEKMMKQLGYDSDEREEFFDDVESSRAVGKLTKWLGKQEGTNVGLDYPLLWFYLCTEYCHYKGNRSHDNFFNGYIDLVEDELGIEEYVEEEIIDEVIEEEEIIDEYDDYMEG